MAVKSEAEQLLLDDLIAAGFPPKVGHAFHEYRRWEFDLCWPQIKLAIEIDGRGRHQREAGEREDLQKINAAIEDGWRVLRYPAASVTTGKRRARIVEQIIRVIYESPCAVESSCVLSGEGEL